MHGSVHLLTPPKPAAGGGFTVEVPGAVLWRPVSVVFTQVNAVAVASRYTTLSYVYAGTTTFCVNAAAVLTTSGETWRFCYSAHRTVAEWNTGTDILLPLEPALLTDECTLVVAIAAANAGDQLSSIAVAVEQFDRADYIPGLGLQPHAVPAAEL